MTEIKEHSFNTGVITINYAEGSTSGPPLILLHGGAARWQSFGVIIPDLAIDWHLYALDFRGHGNSERASGRYRLQDYADDTIAFLRRQLAEPAIVVGHSMGGMIALLVAAQCPSCVRAVVVGDAPLTAETWRAVLDEGSDSLTLSRNLAGGRYSLAEVAAAIPDIPAIHVYHTDPDALTVLLDDFCNTVAGYDMESLLPSIHCPALLLQADPTFGGLMTDAEVERALALLTRPSHVRLEGVSHVLHNEQKEPVLQAITAFLTSL
ncbi:MAG: alpha/beta hydrolase [Chloroflexi bacterium]|nr:alpha/beta hydrolase [Chloroflexota bacterium]